MHGDDVGEARGVAAPAQVSRPGVGRGSGRRGAVCEPDLDVQDAIAQPSAVGEQDGDAEHQPEEVEVVVPSDAVVDPDAVVVGLLDASAADAAVFAAGGFGEGAGAAGWGEGAGTRGEDGVVEGVGEHCVGVVGRVNGGASGDGEVEEEVGWGEEEGEEDVLQDIQADVDGGHAVSTETPNNPWEEDYRWMPVRSLAEIENIYDLGFWDNLRDVVWNRE